LTVFPHGLKIELGRKALGQKKSCAGISISMKGSMGLRGSIRATHHKLKEKENESKLTFNQI
jgi:hypothetical protein